MENIENTYVHVFPQTDPCCENNDHVVHIYSGCYQGSLRGAGFELLLCLLLVCRSHTS